VFGTAGSGHRLVAAALTALVLGGAASVAYAQMDLSGEWLQKMHQDAVERGAGPDIGDYTGMPINDADRMRGDSWTSSKWEQIEHECEPHPADYAPRGPGSMRVWADMDPGTMTVSSWHTEIMWMQPTREIFMDGRAHPPAFAPHTWQGYSTGHWNADMLEVDTDHLKEGWLRRNGLQRSEKAHMKEFVIRHEDVLTLVAIVHDPVYLTEPLIRSSEWVLDPGYHPIVSVCTPVGDVPHPKGWVAYELPGQNDALNEFAIKYGIPIEGVRGGAETIYPEYQQRLLSLPVPTAAKPARKAPAGAAPKGPQ
jgi:hypothetical protein